MADFVVSPLTASIYFPAIPAISKAFRKSTELINLTVHNFFHQDNGNSWFNAIGHDVHDFTRRRSVSVPVEADYHYIWRCSLNYTAPMVWGTISDRRGRRPITAICLLILSLSCVGLALTPTSDYWLLMVLRCLQAAGSASTIAIGSIWLITQVGAWFLLYNRCRRHWGYFHSRGTWRFFRIFYSWSNGASYSIFKMFSLDIHLYVGWTIHWTCDRWRALR